MLCQKKLIIGFGIFLPVLLSVFFVSPSYALSDIVVTTDQSNTGEVLCTGSECTGYKYLKVEFSDLSFNVPANNSHYVVFSLRRYNNSNLQSTNVRFVYSGSIFDISSVIDSSDFYSLFVNSGQSLPTGATYTATWTLMDSYSTCPEPEEPEPCPVISDNPYDDKLDSITIAIYTCAGTLLVLYFFYCIYRLIIKSSGVDRL